LSGGVNPMCSVQFLPLLFFMDFPNGLMFMNPCIVIQL